MFCFHKKKKKDYKIFVIIGIVIGVAAAAVGGYFLFTKVLKDKLFKKKDDACECDAAEECCDCCDEAAEVIEEIVEAVEE